MAHSGGPCGNPDCPCMYTTIQEWCDHRNAVMPRQDVRWIVDATGKAMLSDNPDWSLRRKIEISRHDEDERRKFNHRLNYPVTRVRDPLNTTTGEE